MLVDRRATSEIKISDFGLSKILADDGETMQTICGTRAYSAPEVNFGGQRGSARYTSKVDTWSLGVMLYVVLAAYHPFDPYGDSGDAEIWARICRGEWNFDDEVWDSISDEAKDLIQHLLSRNPSKRYGTQELLAHRWVTQYNSMPSTPLRSLSSSQGRSLRNVLSSSGPLPNTGVAGAGAGVAGAALGQAEVAPGVAAGAVAAAGVAPPVAVGPGQPMAVEGAPIGVVPGAAGVAGMAASVAPVKEADQMQVDYDNV